MAGCATTASTEVETSKDPLELINRPIYAVNDFLDRNVANPMVDTYVEYTPEPIRHSVSNFFDHIAYPNVILNDFLQGKGKQGLEDSGRFVVNSTFGLFGIYDMATPLGLIAHDEDFGQTLGYWGAGEGFYLVLPFIGPNSVRDAPDLGVSTVTNILFYVANPLAVPVSVLSFLDKRARLDRAVEFRDAAAVEPYLFTREAYLQRRTFLIYDGDPPLDDDLFLDESFADLELEEELEESPIIEDKPPPEELKPEAHLQDEPETASPTASIR